ncbi:MAG: hypothetical protein LBI19_08065 [Oscillospiraceae bacterium]|jgi:DNA-directed RNA polymerase subunit RPC12/RpoP|nr:hypothetical protein [Oscillospiraceae bacterium]
MRLNIIIDGTWLFKQCGPNRVLSTCTANKSTTFNINFDKLNNTLLEYIKNIEPSCDTIGDCFISTSIFDIDGLTPPLDDWPTVHTDVTVADVDKMKKGIHARKVFTEKATIRSCYSDMAVYRPRLKKYNLKNIVNKKHQEKEVDTTVVALLVKYAIKNPDDYHAIITGDADILPAIRIAYPEYTRNVFLVTSHPDELEAENRQSSWKLSNFNFHITPLYLQDCIDKIMYGTAVYKCARCSSVFDNGSPIPETNRPYCPQCETRRT